MFSNIPLTLHIVSSRLNNVPVTFLSHDLTNHREYAVFLSSTLTCDMKHTLFFFSLKAGRDWDGDTCHAEAGAYFSSQQRLQPFLLLLLVAKQVEHLHIPRVCEKQSTIFQITTK